MAATTTNEVELIIRARNLSTKTVKQLNEELGQVEESQRQVADANKLAERSFESLKTEQQQLLAVMKSLNERSDRMNGFERQRERVMALQKQLATARSLLGDLATQFYQTEKPTKEFTEQMRRADQAVNTLDRQLGAAQKRLDAAGAKLSEMGVDTNQFDKSQRQLNTALEASVRLYKQSTNNLERYDAAITQVRAEQQAAAAEERAAAASARTDAEVQAAAAKQREEALRRSTQFAERMAETYRKLAAEGRKAAEATAAFRQGGVQAGANAAAVATPRVGAAAGTAGAAQAVAAILEPAREAVATLDRLEKEVNDLESEFKQLTPQALRSADGMQKLAEQSVRLRTASAALKAQATLVDELRKQQTALDASTQAFELARAEVLRYAQAVAQADEPNEALAASLVRAQNELKQTHAELTRQTEAFNKVDARARAAGITVNDMAEAERKLATTAGQVSTQQNKVAQTITKLGDETDRATRKQNLFNNSQRTALSLYQRTRGQLLSIISTYVGFFGAINLGQQSIDSLIQRERVLSRLLVASKGDTKAAAEEYDYLQQKADELGLAFGPLSEAYSRFSVAARDAGMSAEATRYIFEAFSEASVALRLSGDETAGAFRALEQIFSKGYIQAEELRGQLGDRMTGAFNLFATAIGVSTAQLNKMMEAGGKVRAEFVLLAAQQARSMYSDRAKEAADSLLGDINRLGNEWIRFKQTLAESSFAVELEKLLVKLTSFMKSDEGARFAQQLGKVFGDAAKGFSALIDDLVKGQGIISELANLVAFLARNVRVLIGAYIALEATKVVLFFGSLALQMRAANAAQVALNTSMGVGTVAAAGKARVALAALMSGPVAALVALAAVGIAIPVYFIYKNAQNEIAAREAQNQRLATVDELTDSFGKLENAIDSAATAGSQQTQENIAKAKELLATYEEQKKVLREQAEARLAAQRTRAEGIEDLSKGGEWRVQMAEARRQAIAEMDQLDKDTAARFDNLEERAARLRALIGTKEGEAAQQGGDAISEALAAEIARLEEEARLAALDTGDEDEGKRKAEKLAADRIRLAEETAKALREIDDDLLKAQDTTLDNRVALVRSEFEVRRQEMEALIAEAKKLGLSAEADALTAKLEKLQQLEEITIQKTTLEFNNEKIAANEQKINDLLSQRKTELESINILLEAGMITQSEASDRILAVNERMVPQLQAATAAAREFLKTLGDSPEAHAALLALDNLEAQVVTIGTELSAQTQQVIDVYANNFTNGLMEIAKLMGNVIMKTEDSGDAFKQFGRIVLQTIANILLELAQMIIMQTIFNALKNAAQNSGGGFWGNLINMGAQALQGAGKSHNGGLVGTGAARTVHVPSYVFASAISYHDGGLAGLKPNEVPTILKRNEEVLTENDPRHRFNGGGGAPQPVDLKITQVNVFDREEVAGEVMKSKAMGEGMLNFISRNASAIRQRLGGR